MEAHASGNPWHLPWFSSTLKGHVQKNPSGRSLTAMSSLLLVLAEEVAGGEGKVFVQLGVAQIEF